MDQKILIGIGAVVVIGVVAAVLMMGGGPAGPGGGTVPSGGGGTQPSGGGGTPPSGGGGTQPSGGGAGTQLQLCDEYARVNPCLKEYTEVLTESRCQMETGYKQDWCYHDLALQKKDVGFCDTLVNENGGSLKYFDYADCVSDVGLWVGQNLCQKVIERAKEEGDAIPSDYGTCIMSMAFGLGVDECEMHSVPVEGIEYSESLTRMAQVFNATEVEFNRARCISGFVSRAKDASLCDRIENSELKELCIEDSEE